MAKFINKDELKYIVIATIFSFFLFVLILPNILSYIDGVSPWIQFLIFNIGIFIFLQIFLTSIATGKKFKIAYSLGIVLLFMSLDLWMPPMAVNLDGTLNSSMTLSQSSSDYIFGMLAQQMGMLGFLVYLFTYVFVPLILLLISSLLLKNFVKEL